MSGFFDVPSGCGPIWNWSLTHLIYLEGIVSDNGHIRSEYSLKCGKDQDSSLVASEFDSVEFSFSHLSCREHRPTRNLVSKRKQERNFRVSRNSTKDANRLYTLHYIPHETGPDGSIRWKCRQFVSKIRLYGLQHRVVVPLWMYSIIWC